MQINSKGRYAVAAMVDLAINHEHGPVPLADLSERQFISLSYLEQLFRGLREAGLVRSVRGPGGGYLLNKPAVDISIADIMLSVNEDMRQTLCSNASRGCHNGGRCNAHELWSALGTHIQNFLQGISLDDVCHRRVAVEHILAVDV